MNKTSRQVEIDFNPEFQRALALMEDTAQNLLITGRAGTGKSTLLNYFRDHTKKKSSRAGANRRCCSQCYRADDSFFLSLQTQCYTGIGQKEKKHVKRKDYSL